MEPSTPDNTRLLQLLDQYAKKDGDGETYKNVIMELMNGISFLIFPTQDDTNLAPGQWTTLETAATLKISSIFEVNGSKMFGVFTDESSLFSWTKTPTHYNAMRAQDILKLGQTNDIEKIVINNGLPNMFVLEKSKK